MPLNAVTVKIVLVVKMVLASVAAKSGRESGFRQCDMEYTSDKYMEYMAPQKDNSPLRWRRQQRGHQAIYRLPKLSFTD
jgi:hypothetical protein